MEIQYGDQMEILPGDETQPDKGLKYGLGQYQSWIIVPGDKAFRPLSSSATFLSPFF